MGRFLDSLKRPLYRFADMKFLNSQKEGKKWSLVMGNT